MAALAIGTNTRTTTTGRARPTRTRFIGQCLLQGYSGVGRADVFPALAARRLETSLEETRVAVSADTPQISDDVNVMTRRIAEAAQLPMVDRMAIGRHHPSLFLPGSVRYSRLGHRVMGEALAELLLDAGLVQPRHGTTSMTMLP
jgi:hypothetical protein